MRPKSVDVVVMMLGIRAVLLAALISIVIAAPVTAVVGPYNVDPSGTEVMLVLEDSANPSDVDNRLQEAGFAASEMIKGLSPRYGNYRLLTVSSMGSDTRADLLAIDGIRSVRSVYRGGGVDYPMFTTGQVVAKFDFGTSSNDVARIAAENGCVVSRHMFGQTYLLDVLNENATSVTDAASGIESSSGTVYSHPSMLLRMEKHAVDDSVIEDPYYSWQWHLNNTGQLDGGVVDADIDAPEAWTITMGENAIVAVIDDAIQKDHEDLIENYLTGYDFLDDDDDPSPFYGPSYWMWEDYGDAHGTATSGLICAAANSVGVRGVAPMSSLIGCKIGLGWLYTSDADVADAFLFAEQNGAMVINNSWGGPGGVIVPTISNTDLDTPNLISDAIEYVSTEGRGGLGCLVLFSSGNSGIMADFDNRYAGLPQVVAVGASMRDDTLACYSSFGPVQSVVAPGGGLSYGRDLPYYGYDDCFERDITTTDVMEVPGYDPLIKFMEILFEELGVPVDLDPVESYPIRGYNPPMKFLDVLWPLDPSDPLSLEDALLVPDEYAPEDLPDVNYTRRFDGTSAACPVASGVAALIFSVDPGLSAREVRNILEHTADKPNSADANFDAVTGHSRFLGHGRVNAFQAASAALRGEKWPSPPENVGNATIASRAHLIWDLPDWDSDGLPDEDIEGVLVVQGPKNSLNWSPTDGVSYTVGQQVAAGTTIVANDLIETLILEEVSYGSYEYAVFVRNEDDFYSWGRRVEVDIEQPLPGPTTTSASIRASVTTGQSPLTVEFTGGGVDPDGNAFVLYNWDFGDGATGSGAWVSHTYQVSGTFMVTLTATTTGAQAATATQQITVLAEANEPPTAAISATPKSGDPPLAVLFEAEAEDVDGSIVSYQWRFGDGATGTGQVTEHVYIDPGNFVATLTVTDNMGDTAQATQMISVGGGSTTAGATVPESALGDRVVLPNVACGSGTAGALVISLAAMLGMMAIRRRR